MPTPSSGRESRKSSKSGPSGTEAYKSSSDRRSKAKSSVADETRRRPSQQVEAQLAIASEHPTLKSRTNSAPHVQSWDDEPNRRDAFEVDDGQTRDYTSTASTPRIGVSAVEFGRDEDEIAGVVGAVKNFQPFQTSEHSAVLPDINIAIIGAPQVGKSTFMQKALDLPFPSDSQAVERKIGIDGTDYLLRLLEVPIEDVDVDDDTVGWPETIEDKITPKIDGALTLYDVKDESSLDNVPKMLNAIQKAGIPSLFVSCKCDASLDERDVDPRIVEHSIKRRIKHLQTLQVSTAIADSHQQGVSMILKAIISDAPGERMRSSSTQRRRAQSNAVRPVSPRTSDRGHARATSEYTGGLYKDQLHARHDSSLAAYNSNDRLKVPYEASEEDGVRGSFLIEESTSEGTQESNESSDAELAEAQASQGADSSSSLPDSGVTFHDLVNRLLAQPTSKSDHKFAAIFLALYRKFAAPEELLEAIVERFDALERDGCPHMIKTMNQLRFLYVLSKWVGTYPGDFAHPRTKHRMRTFVGKLSQSRIFSAAAKEMNADLDAAHEDDDTIWAYSDEDRPSAAGEPRTSLSSTASTLLDDPSFLITDDDASTQHTLADDATFSVAPTGDLTQSASSVSTQLFVNVEAARRQAELLYPIPRQPVTKVQWRLLMDCPEDVVARELTKIDSIMFCCIRPRDLVRQVSLKGEEKAKYKNLVYVNRMIDHFNQLSSWVQNYILLRDKPKHRALMLEKFMKIARKLREVNNYNALGAIIAGVKNSSIQRLAATRELIPPNIGKDWMKLDILMGPTRSHSAYRLAWENSSAQRIPYLPLHRRDLVSAEEGNKTFVGDEKDGRVNWRKFEVMGEVVVSMQKAQSVPYKNLTGWRENDQIIKELFLDVKLVKDEDELFMRSKQVEPSATATGGTSARFKDFFKR